MKPVARLGLVLAMSYLISPWTRSSFAAETTRLMPIKGKIRIEGTSNIDTWQVESKSLGGFLQVGPAFPIDAGHKTAPGPVEAHGEVTIEAQSLKSIEQDGKPFSNKMDGIMYDALRAKEHPKIVFRLNRMVLRVASRANDAPNEFDVNGRLEVGGVVNEVELHVRELALSHDELRLWGNTTIKMTDFRIPPPSPTITLGLVKTGDEVKISFEWVLSRQH